MENIALIGIDLGKNSFHIHCQDRRGKAVYRKKFTRPKLIEFLATCPATTIAMEACGGSHFMARKLEELGHSPKLISPQFVRPFVKSNKNDFVDAEAICEAASRPSMRFVQPRTESQQAMRALHRVRESLVQDKVKTTNQMHAFLLEFGISVPRGAAVISRLSTILEDNSLPLYLSQLLLKLQQHYHYLVEQIKDLESQLKRKLDEDEVGQRLLSIPCVGTLTASTISTSVRREPYCGAVLFSWQCYAREVFADPVYRPVSNDVKDITEVAFWLHAVQFACPIGLYSSAPALLHDPNRRTGSFAAQADHPRAFSADLLSASAQPSSV
jgi:transposase